MKRSEWAAQVARLQARWPRQPVSPESAAIWFDDLAEFPVGQVEAAIVALYRDGREWCPNGAQIRLKVLDLATGQLDHGAAYALALEAAGPRGGYIAGLDWLRDQDPVVAAAVEHYGWRGFCLSDTPDATRRAQFRDIYKETASSAERNDRYRGIPPAGLRTLERANDRPARFGELIEVDRNQIERKAA